MAKKGGTTRNNGMMMAKPDMSMMGTLKTMPNCSTKSTKNK